MRSIFVTPFYIWLLAIFMVYGSLLKKGHAKRGLPTFLTVNYDNNDILQT